MSAPFLTAARRPGPAPVTANQWPFFWISPVAYETPPDLMVVLMEYCAAGKALGDAFTATNAARKAAGLRSLNDPVLKRLCRTEAEAGMWFKQAADEAEDKLVGHPGYHRVGGELVGVVWRAHGPHLDTRPAYTEVTSFPTRDPRS